MLHCSSSRVCLEAVRPMAAERGEMRAVEMLLTAKQEV